MAASRAVREVSGVTAAEAERIYGDMEGRLPELAAELAATPQFSSAGTAGARKQRARFLIEKTGGYPPTTRFFEFFLDTPPVQRSKR
jgi:hypothetical protein